MYLCVQNYGSNLSRLLLQEYHSDNSIDFFSMNFYAETITILTIYHIMLHMVWALNSTCSFWKPRVSPFTTIFGAILLSPSLLVHNLVSGHFAYHLCTLPCSAYFSFVQIDGYAYLVSQIWVPEMLLARFYVFVVYLPYWHITVS